MACSISIIIDHILIVISFNHVKQSVHGARGVSVSITTLLYAIGELLENGGFIYMPAVKVPCTRQGLLQASAQA